MVILNLEDYVYISPEAVLALKSKQEFVIKALTPGTEVCFRVTEPNLETFVP